MNFTYDGKKNIKFPHENNQILIIDSFYENPDNVRNIALVLKYKEPLKKFISNDNKYCFFDGWRGFRCKIGKNLNEVVNKDKLLKNIIDFYLLPSKKYGIDMYFHYCLERTKNTCFPSFEQYKYHKDNCDYSGVLYLAKNPPKKTGTIIFDHLNNKIYEIENIYNRLICYPANFLHAPIDLFGEDIYDGRLTLTFFITKIF